MTHSTQDLCKKSIAVFRSLPGLGDFLCVIPALRALRAAFPTAQIVWIGLPNVAEWVTRFDHYIDEFVEFPGYVADIPLRLAHCHENPYQLLTDWVKDPEPEDGIRHEVQRQLNLVATIEYHTIRLGTCRIGCYFMVSFANIAKKASAPKDTTTGCVKSY